MKITRKTNVFVTSERGFIVRHPFSKQMISCENCVRQMIPAQATADFFGLSSREFYRPVEKKEIHFMETETIEAYVCPVSIEKQRQHDCDECVSQTEIYF